jgi:hypothetical protein
MNPESEFDQWRRAWTERQVDSPAASGLAATHRRQERRLRIRYVLNLLAAAILILFAALVLRGNFRAETIAWASVVWLTTLGSTAFYVWNWRSLWRTAGKSVRDHADVCEARCLDTLRAVRFGYGFLAVQFAIAAPWLTWDFWRGEITAGRYGLRIGLLVALSAVFILWFRASRRDTVEELTRIREFRRELGDEDANIPSRR